MNLNKKKIITILGTRPEIIKLSQLIPKLDYAFNHVLIHTNQHYSYEMDSVFFKELKLRKPDYNLNASASTSIKQIAKMIVKLESIFQREKPNLVLVQGDTNSSVAGALAASKNQVKIAHIEAGCRYFNKERPEETNRIITDHCSDFLFVPGDSQKQNVLNEGINKKAIFIVGNTSIDACLRNKKIAQKSKILRNLNLHKKKYVLVTLHRAENTDNKRRLSRLIEAINHISNKFTAVFPMHPRTKKMVKQYRLELSKNIRTTEPLGYLDFLQLLENAHFVLSDSGGIQEEAATLNIPCLILANNTEWDYYVKAGKNCLVGTNKKDIISTVDYLTKSKKIQAMSKKKVKLIKNASKRITEKIMSLI